jgi:aspartate oxidase
MHNYLRANSTRRVASVSLAVVIVIAAAVGITIWRYQVAQSDSAAALDAGRDASTTNELTALFWHEREAMADYLFRASPDLSGFTAEIASIRQQFIRAAATITPASPTAAQVLSQALAGHAHIYSVFLAVRPAGTTSAP